MIMEDCKSSIEFGLNDFKVVGSIVPITQMVNEPDFMRQQQQQQQQHQCNKQPYEPGDEGGIVGYLAREIDCLEEIKDVSFEELKASFESGNYSIFNYKPHTSLAVLVRTKAADDDHSEEQLYEILKINDEKQPFISCCDGSVDSIYKFANRMDGISLLLDSSNNDSSSIGIVKIVHQLFYRTTDYSSHIIYLRSTKLFSSDE